MGCVYAIKRNNWIIVQSTLNLDLQKVCWLHFCFLFLFFCFFSSKEHLQVFVDYMHKQHKCIKFTSEAEYDNSFSFLDIKITRHNQKFKASIYRKPTVSGVFTHCESYLDQLYKKSWIETSLFCCFSICSDYNLFHKANENLRESLKRNSYPSGILE